MTLLKQGAAQLAASTCDGTGKEYPRLKYMLARIIAQALAQHPWVSEIYYADLSSGEVVKGLEDGTDIDLLVVTRSPPASPTLLAKHLEIELNQALAEALRDAAPHAARKALTHGIVELHIDDHYARLAARKARRGGLSAINAVKLWPQE